MSTNTASSGSLFPIKVLQLPHPKQRCRKNGFMRMTFQSHDTKDPFLHAYRGQFLRDNYHGDGQYCELHPRKGNTIIDGKFYCNNLEGYANETTSDGNYFEGLFKDNQRFGPGVMTYKNKTQDVGLWRGPNLVRLSIVVQSHVIPKLGETPQGKSMLIQYRQLIELSEFDQKSQTYAILRNAGAGAGVLKKYQQLCNKTCRNKNSLLFDVKLYDDMYFGQKNNFINVVMNEDEILEKERLELEQLEEEERLNNSSDVVGLETVEGILDAVMKGLREPTRNDEFAAQLLYESIGNMEDLLERAKEERELIEIRNSHQRNLKQKYQEHFDKTTLKKVQITHLITWNNEEVTVDLLKHCFLHRNSENLVSFNACRVLAGDRSDFYNAGVKERMSIDFLVNCSRGMVDEVADLVLEKGVDVIVADGRGNCGIHFAAAKDKVEIIQLLTNFGAKLDCVNDEHLTALNICLLRYLAVLHDITNWEDAFLIDKEASPKYLQQVLDRGTAFHPNSSLLNVLSQISIVGSCKGARVPKRTSTLTNNQIEVLSMVDILTKLDVVRYSESSYKIESGGSNYIFANKLRPTTKTSTKQKPSPASKSTRKTAIPDPLEENKKTKELNNINATISALLHFGAKPNICEVPIPSLHLALHTENHSLVEMLLQHGSDVNTCLEEFNLTPLHIACTLPTSEESYLIFKLLLQYSADVTINANAAHWPDETKAILSNYSVDTLHMQMDKNALHILAMRYDYALDIGQYLIKMCSDLIEAGIGVEKLYLGHTALTLAMLRRNFSLVEFLLQYADVQQELGCQMGTALTVLILKRYNNVFSKENAMKMVDLLVASGANPLKRIGHGGNVLEFIGKEYFVDPKASRKKKSGSSKKSKALNHNEEIRNYIHKVAKDILIRNIQITIVKYLMQYHSTKGHFNDLISHLVHFLNCKEFLEIVQQLMYLREIISCACLKPFLLQIGTYINSINPVPLLKGQNEPDKGFLESLDNLDYQTPDREVVKAILKRPEFDQDQKMFDVCFHCLQKVDKYLIKCPGCGVLSFCSEACNRADVNSKLQKRHHCKQLFYNMRDQKMFQGLEEIFIDLSSHRTGCLMGAYSVEVHADKMKSTCSKSSFLVKSTSAKQSTDSKFCRSSRSCRSKQMLLSSTTLKLSNCVHSVFHQSSRSSTETKTPQPRKLSLMENVLKSISNGTDNQTAAIREDILMLSTRKENDSSKYNASNRIGTDSGAPPIAIEQWHSSSVKDQRVPVIEYKKNIYDFTKRQKRHSQQSDSKKTTDHTREIQNKREKQWKKAQHTLKTEAHNLREKGNIIPVLPRGYNRFFVNFRNLFPDFDLTALVLPYACYRNGQLYYRFLDREPIFMETYSNL